MQVNIPQDICLPVQIDRLDVCIDPTENGGDRSSQAILNFKEGREYHCEVVATDAHGLVVEHLQGYRLRILEEHLENPTAAELAAPAQRDRDILTKRLGQVFQQLQLSGATVELAYAPNLGALSRTERRQQEAQLKHSANSWQSPRLNPRQTSRSTAMLLANPFSVAILALN
jgi:enediyne polyketide synthase